MYDYIKRDEKTGRFVRRFNWDKILSFFTGVVTVSFAFYLGYMTCMHIVGWINSPVITPIATETK
jgi:ATP/ADP translocase